jgi:hypothetical protein
MTVIDSIELTSTDLFLRLRDLTGGAESALPGNVRQLCSEAATRLRLFPGIHKQYTLHDDVHSARVAVLMGMLLAERLNTLNAVEITLLLLAAYNHDQGMIVESAELDDIRRSDEWRLHETMWSREHPNRAEVVAHLSDPLLDDTQRQKAAAALADLEAAVFTDFIRQRHGERSAAYVRKQYGEDPRMVINGRNVADLLARICHSHVLPHNALLDSSTYRFAELVGTERVNVSLLTLILRLADILDFDRDRTPDSLYRAISFTSSVSLAEWEKHRSIVGWEISRTRISFSAECAHPAYERAVRQFLRWVEDELRFAAEWSRRLPSEFVHYALDLPTTVDTTGVGPRPNATTGQPEYLYFDLEFTLARDELVKLLMTNELYESAGLFVRELLQNALDALRHRNALFGVVGMSPPALTVRLTHAQDATGYDVVTCVDNGVGMDISVVTNFLTRAGRSYYRSPEFEQERAYFQSAGCDFDPCARFGIGFMSCFMFGDEITIHTRRDYGQGKSYGPPLVIHVTGLSGIVVITNGPPHQPVGTCVEVRSRRKLFLVDEYDDPVRLLAVVEGYALATEYPITAEVTVPGLEGVVEVPTEYSARLHPLESAPISMKRTFTVDLNAVNPMMRGELRLCTLVDEKSQITTGTSEARVEATIPSKLGERKTLNVRLKSGSLVDLDSVLERAQVCADGILIAGPPGRVQRSTLLGEYGSPLDYGGVSALVDARGDLKPALTPARTPVRGSGYRDHTWTRLDAHVGAAYARMLEEVLANCDTVNDPVRPWLVAAAYSLRLDFLPVEFAWRLLQIPAQFPGTEEVGWVPLQTVERSKVTFELGPYPGGAAHLELRGEGRLAVPSQVGEFLDKHERNGFTWVWYNLVLALSTIHIESPTVLVLEPSRANTPTQVLADHSFGEQYSRMRMFRIADVSTGSVLRVYGQRGFANSEHPVTRRVAALSARSREDYTPLDEFLSTLLWNWPLDDSTQGGPAKSQRVARSRLKLGHLHSAIDWEAVPPALRPPYTAFVPGVGVQSLSTDDLSAFV